jgi:hypothetical protein
MKNLLLLVGSICLSACTAWAQGKVDSQWNCSKATDGHSINVGDKEGHVYAITQSSCTATKGELEGIKEKDATSTEFDEIDGNKVKSHGVFVETLPNGDKIYVGFQSTGTMENGQLQSVTDVWTMTGGTGKFKRTKGKGSCKGKGSPDGSTTLNCSGEYTMANK